VLDGLGADFDLVTDAVQRMTIAVLAGSLGVPEPERRPLAEACLAAGVAVDSLLCPQPLGATRRMLDALSGLRALFGRCSPTPADVGVLLAVAGAPIASGLATNAALAALDRPAAWSGLAADPETATRVVRETWRYDPPVHLDALVAQQDVELAGEEVRAGEQVVVVVGAANRDPLAFADPDRFLTDRPTGEAPLLPAPPNRLVVPFAETVAVSALRALAARYPALRPAAPVVRRRRAPVTRGALRAPVSAAAGPDRG
jgi:cytochrome P450